MHLCTTASRGTAEQAAACKNELLAARKSSLQVATRYKTENIKCFIATNIKQHYTKHENEAVYTAGL